MSVLVKPVVGTWAAAATVFAGSYAIAATVGELHVESAYYTVIAGVAATVLLSIAHDRRRFFAEDQAAALVSVCVLLGVAAIGAFVGVAIPPKNPSLAMSVISAGVVGGVVGQLLAGHERLGEEA